MTDATRSMSSRQKWRPSLSLVVFLVLVSVLLLPLFSLYFLKLYQNQLIQQTESELIAQSAALAAVFKREIETAVPESVALGTKIPPAAPKPADEPYHPIWPKLELAKESVLPPRPPAHPASAAADPAFAALGARMMPDLLATQNVTLAGFRLLDPFGTVIAGREETGMSLAHLEEVTEALQGRFSSALRVRISKHDQPSLYSMSRGTGMRVFTAMPVIVRGQVAGVVYASRTPSNVFRYLYDQRGQGRARDAVHDRADAADRLPVSPHHHRADAGIDRAQQSDRQGRPQRAGPAEAPRHQRVRPPVAELPRHGAAAGYALKFHLDLRHPRVA